MADFWLHYENDLTHNLSHCILICSPCYLCTEVHSAIFLCAQVPTVRSYTWDYIHEYIFYNVQICDCRYICDEYIFYNVATL
jgi:hypothetical protein